MSPSVIVQRKANQTPPDAFWELILQNCSKIWSATIVADDKIEIAKGENCTLDLIKETIADFKDCNITFYFADAEKGSNLKDHPPYDIIANDDDEPLVVLLAEGNFPAHDKSGNGSSHPPIYHLAEKLSDEFFSVYDMSDKDLKKFFTNIQKEHFTKKMKLESVSRGYITVMTATGDAMTYGQGDTAKEFDWGWASNTFGFGGKKEEPKAEEPKRRGMFSRPASSKEKHTPHQPSNAVAAAVADNPPKTDTAIPKTTDTGSNNPQPETRPKPAVLTIENITKKKVKIPEMSRKLRKGWIKARLGYTPPTVDNPDQVYEVYVSPTGAYLTRDDINRALGMSAAKLFGDKPLQGNPKPTGKDTDTDHIDPDKQVSGDPLPILSPNARQGFQKYLSDDRIKKVIAEGAEQITAPDYVQGLETKLAPFHNQLGLKTMEDFDALPFAEHENICRQNFHGYATMGWTWRNRAIKAEMELARLKGKAPKEEPKAETVEEKPARRGMFSRKVA